MRTIGVFFGITALAAVVFSPLPVAAFGIHLGPFHFGFGHHLHTRTNPNEARTRANDVSRGGSYSTAARGNDAAKTDQTDRETARRNHFRGARKLRRPSAGRDQSADRSDSTDRSSDS